MLPVESAAIEIERLVIEGLRQHVRHGDEVVIGEVSTPAFYGDRTEELREGIDGVDLAKDEYRLRRQSVGLQQGGPGNSGILQLLAGSRVVGQIAFASLGYRPVRAGNLRFDSNDRFGIVRCRGVASQTEQALYMRGVLGAQLNEYRLVLEVVVPVGHAEPALRYGDGIAIGVLLIGDDPNTDGRFEIQIAAAHQTGQVIVGLRGGDSLKRRLRGGQARPLNRVGVQVASVEIADFPLRAARRRRSERDPSVY